jgi:hypothetical protein
VLLAYGAGGRPLASVVIVDSKRDRNEWAAWGPRFGYVVTSDWHAIREHPLVVYQVDQLALDDRPGWDRPGTVGYSWTEALMAIFARGRTVCLFDEAGQTLPAPSAHPHARRILTQGRSLHVSAWAGAQRPLWIDTFVMRLSEHVFCFKVTDANDRRELEKARGAPSDGLGQLPDKHFAYHRLGMDAWQICTPAPADAFKGRGNRRVAEIAAAPATDNA